MAENPVEFGWVCVDTRRVRLVFLTALVLVGVRADSGVTAAATPVAAVATPTSADVREAAMQGGYARIADKLERASLTLARLLYQELVMEGGQVVTAPRLEHVGQGETDVLMSATRYQFNHVLGRLRWQPSVE